MAPRQGPETSVIISFRPMATASSQALPSFSVALKNWTEISDQFLQWPLSHYQPPPRLGLNVFWVPTHQDTQTMTG